MKPDLRAHRYRKQKTPDQDKKRAKKTTEEYVESRPHGLSGGVIDFYG